MSLSVCTLVVREFEREVVVGKMGIAVSLRVVEAGNVARLSSIQAGDGVRGC